MQLRKIKKILTGTPTREGAGVNLQRIFGFNEVPEFDPFLLMDHFGSDNPQDYERGFPLHPHRGIETITYLLEGSVKHKDSLGNTGRLTAGDVQWMTAGSGIIHEEMPQGDTNGRMFGFQLWANLPASHKMMPPRYQDIKAGEIPVLKREDGIEIRVICGKVDNIEGPVQDIIIDPEYLDVMMPADTTFVHAAKKTHTVFAYVFAGEVVLNGSDDNAVISNGSLVMFDQGDEIKLSCRQFSARFLLVSGKPIGEQIAWHGPIVMNTKQELAVAVNEFRDGTFVKHNHSQ